MAELEFPTIQIQAEKFNHESRRLTSNLYELLPEADPDVELVFFHGLQMEGSDPAHSFWRTWKMINSEECWPEVLLPRMLIDSQIKARVISVSYEGRPNLGKDGLGTDRSDQYLITESLVQDLVLARVGQRDRVPVFLVGHDLGGILIKILVMMVERQAEVVGDERDQLQAKLNKFLENLKAVFFYATPHSGSPAIAEVAARIDENDQNQMLRLMKVLEKETARINAQFQQYRRNIGARRSRFTSHAVHAVNRTKEGGFVDVLVVPEGSARNDVDYGCFVPVSADHFSVCQAKDLKCSSLQILSQKIKEEVRRARGETV